jgi:hypothetical protein
MRHSRSNARHPEGSVAVELQHESVASLCLEARASGPVYPPTILGRAHGEYPDESVFSNCWTAVNSVRQRTCGENLNTRRAFAVGREIAEPHFVAEDVPGRESLFDSDG